MTHTLSTRLASSDDEREAIFRLRYRVYVEEMGRLQKDADHARHRTQDTLDSRGHLLGAWNAGALVGTVRTNFLREDDIGVYRELYRLDQLADHEAKHSSITTRMMVLAQARHTRVALRLADGGA